MSEYDDAGPVMKELCSLAKRTFIYLSYGEYDGLRVPSAAELLVMRGYIDGALQELRTQHENDVRSRS